jgi:hypothetical protein
VRATGPRPKIIVSAEAICDLAVLRDQTQLFGPVAAVTLAFTG